MTDEDKSDIFRSVLCTSPESVRLPASLGSAVSVQTGLVVADTSCSPAVSFLQKELLVTFKDTRTAAQFLRENDGLEKCLVEHYLELQRDVLGIGKMARTVQTGDEGHVRVRSVSEINSHEGDDLRNVSKTLSDSAVFATRSLLEVVHDMVIELASDVLLEETSRKDDIKNETSSNYSLINISTDSDSALDTSDLSSYLASQDKQQELLSLSPVSSCSLPSSSSNDCLDSDREEEDEKDMRQLEKLLQDKQSLLSQIVELEIAELQRNIVTSPPVAYQGRNFECEQFEPVSSEEEEPVHTNVNKKRTRQTRKKPTCGSKCNLYKKPFEKVKQ